MKFHSFDEVMKLDNALRHLAMYEVTKGMIISPKSQDEALMWQTKISEKFNEFKNLIQNGECSFEFIKEQVLSKNGPFPHKKIDPTSSEFLQKITEWEREQEKNKENKNLDKNKNPDPVRSLLTKMLRSMFPEAESIDITLTPVEGKKSIPEIPPVTNPPVLSDKKRKRKFKKQK